MQYKSILFLVKNQEIKKNIFIRKALMLIGFLYVILGSIALTIGDLFMKTWVDKNSYGDFSIGFVCYLVGMLFLAFSFKYKNIAIASMMLVLFNIITLIIVSWFLFKEPISIKEAIGMALGISAIILLESH